MFYLKIYFVRRKKHSLFNLLTKWATKSDITHVLVAHYDPISRREIAYQANGKGVHFMDVNRFLEQDRIVLDCVTYHVNEEILFRYMNHALKHVMLTKYDLLGAFGLGLWHKYGVYLSEMFDGDNSLSCAEATTKILEFALNIELGEDGIMSPGQLHQILKSGISYEK